MITVSSPNPALQLGRATFRMPSGSSAPDPAASLWAGTPKIISPPTPAVTASSAALIIESRVCWTTPGIEAISAGASMPSRTNIGSTRSLGRTATSATSRRSAAVERSRRSRDVGNGGRGIVTRSGYDCRSPGASPCVQLAAASARRAPRPRRTGRSAARRCPGALRTAVAAYRLLSAAARRSAGGATRAPDPAGLRLAAATAARSRSPRRGAPRSRPARSAQVPRRLRLHVHTQAEPAAVAAVAGPMQATTVLACGFPCDADQALRTVEDVKQTARNPGRRGRDRRGRRGAHRGTRSRRRSPNRSRRPAESVSVAMSARGRGRG